MGDPPKYPLDTINTFKECLTCSRTFGHILNREFDHPMDAEERALDPLAGGILNQGHQCGMLWGATLAIGAESFRRYKDTGQAIAVAVTATQGIIESFINRTGTINCREIIGIDISRVMGLVKFILKTTLQGTKRNPCYHLAEQWAPEAVQSATESLNEDPVQLSQIPRSCASEVVMKMGGSMEEMVMVSGFAGGLGLSGNGCGALSAAIWMKTLAWCKEHPGKTPPYFNNPDAKRIFKAFREETGDEIICRSISGQSFNSIDDHSAYIGNGGCNKLIEVLTHT